MKFKKTNDTYAGLIQELKKHGYSKSYIAFLEEKGITHDSLGRICFERNFIEQAFFQGLLSISGSI